MNGHKLCIDEEHEAAIDLLLLLADDEAGWKEHDRALGLLVLAEEAGRVLSPEYQLKRHLWDAALAS